MTDLKVNETSPLTSSIPSPYPSSKPKVRWTLQYFPERTRGYLELIRLDKPTGTILMFWPFAWGLTFAAYHLARTSPTPSPLSLAVYFRMLGQSFVSAFLIRSSACTVNDIFDRKVDAGVERTKNRPMPSGRVSVLGASIYLAIQYILSVVWFRLTLDNVAFCAALIQLLPLFCIYPLLKRFTHWPQAWLGFAMNFGLVISWTQLTGYVDYRLMGTLMAGAWCWTMLYDTIYACQDLPDDIKTGVKSTAILFGSWIRPLLQLIGSTFVIMFGIAGILNGQTWIYGVVAVGGTALHVVWQFWTVDLNVAESCWTNFKRNGHLGWIIWAGLMLDYIVASRMLPMISWI
ncbi:hypothetical protein JAAARDRAFT_294251 [Jaapia argillacea MUCL 33604]|uniref:4-hydroxybenzoate polyprenyltransferase, mitochondrial n=1 Tax=Jaapia argillacea MUCL 33604 TaxID=933084 RepID=A0A067Q1Q1_9AGAM|nr:hypothetical protein JAAARDRAFT_294251 [Jaapia argillacea MUCL 33604]